MYVKHKAFLQGALMPKCDYIILDVLPVPDQFWKTLNGKVPPKMKILLWFTNSLTCGTQKMFWRTVFVCIKKVNGVQNNRIRTTFINNTNSMCSYLSLTHHSPSGYLRLTLLVEAGTLVTGRLQKKWTKDVVTKIWWVLRDSKLLKMNWNVMKNTYKSKKTKNKKTFIIRICALVINVFICTK